MKFIPLKGRLFISVSFFFLHHYRNILLAWQHRSCCCCCTAMTQPYCLFVGLCHKYNKNSFYAYDTAQQTQAIMLRYSSTTTATGSMLPCRQDVAIMVKQEERYRDKQSTLQRCEFHFTSIKRTSSVTYFAVRKTTQHKLPQLKIGPTIYAIGLPVLISASQRIQRNKRRKGLSLYTTALIL